MRRILLFYILFLFSSVALADDFFRWYLGSNQSVTYPSAAAACDAATLPSYDPSVFKDAKKTGVILQQPNSGWCQWEREYISGGFTESSYIRVVRLGSMCPPDTTYNEQTGSCDQDCSDTIGQHLLVRGPDSLIFTSNGVNPDFS